MKKFLMITTFLTMILPTGCMNVSQEDCLDEGRFKYNGLCKKWEDIPVEDQELKTVIKYAYKCV